jgi:hypothetical protein
MDEEEGPADTTTSNDTAATDAASTVREFIIVIGRTGNNAATIAEEGCISQMPMLTFENHLLLFITLLSLATAATVAKWENWC